MDLKEVDNPNKLDNKLNDKLYNKLDNIKKIDDMTNFDDLEQELLGLEYPEIELETDDIKLILTLKKDYSKIKDLENRKKEFIKDINDFIDEFIATPEFEELMEYY
ncbi:hypothetical protein MARBORIA2_16970 [Methanobrevibacter arboriphilus]|jgi:uncharacterized FlgJ-related protein|uniref:Uncharacterized protein n=2 Tax=Methanobrevibacter arboriphilus TaxID=39441 RepID=A0ACA8R1G6_METAZ|nr:hypothetical protein [Methanobrevibacter arboriphilus]BBL61067.1 hypothetical protein MarbSA_01070 [Methanobrevibacter arboriphilus]GLI12607.1 hypothetical protein MARBORIA2_16970 [Methanobrevibacter arboriphilus]